MSLRGRITEHRNKTALGGNLRPITIGSGKPAQARPPAPPPPLTSPSRKSQPARPNLSVRAASEQRSRCEYLLHVHTKTRRPGAAGLVAASSLLPRLSELIRTRVRNIAQLAERKPVRTHAAVQQALEADAITIRPAEAGRNAIAEYRVSVQVQLATAPCLKCQRRGRATASIYCASSEHDAHRPARARSQACCVLHDLRTESPARGRALFVGPRNAG